MQKIKILVAASIAGCALATGVQAQVTVPVLPTNVPGVSVVKAPPANFNAVTASAAARAQYAIPPAPDSKTASSAYNEWVKAVSGLNNRAGNPTVELTNIGHGPVQKVGPAVTQQATNGTPGEVANNVVTATSGNWSGPSIVNSNKPFATEAIIGEFVVPTARQAFGSCTGGWNYSSMWPGIDGNGSGDVLQAGVEADAYCYNGAKQTLYSAWIEWYPFNETRVSSPAVNPGDVVFVEVWNTSATQGYAYLYNFSTQTGATYALTAPAGTKLVGNSVEWIVERPSVNGGLANLTNYIDTAWPYNIAWNYTASAPTYYYPDYAPAAGTLELISMLDNNSKVISSASPQNYDFLFFTNTGSSFGTGSQPTVD